MPDPLPVQPQPTRLVLDGRVVPMVEAGDDIASGRVYIEDGRIVAVQTSRKKAPAGFSKVPVIKTGGTIFPGMIELHNHLSYNALPLWNVPKKYDNRSQWGRHPDYRKLVSGPMSVLGRTDGLLQAVVRWVETKCLVAGVTTSQGVKLFSNSGATRFYKGLIRNVEDTDDDPLLPEADTRIGDVEAKNAQKFLAGLERREEKGRKLILHLAEGVDDRANDHFRALKVDKRTWAINESLIGIHATGLRNRNFATIRSRGGSIVWSPLSNLLLYGDTTDVARAQREKLPVSLGSDWAPSGSKNLLMELTVARAWADLEGIALSDFDIVSMATRVPAQMMGWGGELGTIEAGKRADLMVIDDKATNPCARLIEARESSVVLVVVDGVRRYGQRRLMKGAGLLESARVAGVSRAFNLSQSHVDPVVDGLSVADAKERLSVALANLPTLATNLEDGSAMSLDLASGSLELDLGGGATLDDAPGRWFLDLEQDHDDPAAHGPGIGHHQLVLDGHRTGVFDPSIAASVPLSELLEPIQLDALTAVEDPTFWRTMADERNVPAEIKGALFDAYGRHRIAFTEGASIDDDPTGGWGVHEELSLDERRLIVEQATLVLEQAYAHLPFKRSLHAVDPIQRLRLLDYRLSQQVEGEQSEVGFHREMIDIFTTLRDLHTTYVVPARYRRAVLFLPFRVESCFEPVVAASGTEAAGDSVVVGVEVNAAGRVAADGAAGGAEPGRREVFLASKVDGEAIAEIAALPAMAGGVAGAEGFVDGMEITHWNGVPIRRAIEVLAEKQAAGNDPAAFSRALDALALRPMLSSMRPDEDWVTVTYIDAVGVSREIRFEWQHRHTPPELLDDELETALGIDAQTHAVGSVRKDMYASSAWSSAAERKGKLPKPMALRDGHLETTMPWFFRAHRTPDAKLGYIRIFSFATRSPQDFVAEFARLVEQLPDAGLIIDVRGNAGGSIVAAEGLLQVLTADQVRAQRAQFTTSPLLLDICKRHAPSDEFGDLDLGEWIDSLAQAVATGSSYSRGFPITPDAALAPVDNPYAGPVVVIVDALCYSATDMFAAGFRDNGIGTIVGTADNTGAGGANVWRHSDLLRLAGPDSDLVELPGGIDMRVAVRRTTRVLGHEGEILEDLGIDIDARHYMTRDDLFKGNCDLIDFAASQLARGKQLAESS